MAASRPVPRTAEPRQAQPSPGEYLNPFSGCHDGAHGGRGDWHLPEGRFTYRRRFVTAVPVAQIDYPVSAAVTPNQVLDADQQVPGAAPGMPSGAKPVTVTQPGDLTVDEVYIHPGKGAVLSAATHTQPSGARALYVITDEGVAYPVVSSAALTYLGFGTKELAEDRAGADQPAAARPDPRPRFGRALLPADRCLGRVATTCDLRRRRGG